jgi:hypothetical protein
MTPGIYNIETRQGRDFKKTFTFYDEDGIALLDLSTWAVSAEIRRTQQRDSTLYTTFTVDIDLPTSTITLTLTELQTQDIPVIIAYYDILVTIGTDSQSYIEGKVKNYGGATQV